ncbi:hypothetical protein LXL04_029208 [Taraxacum kok-saghyz]
MSHIREFEHLKITLEAIKSATNNFAAENCIGRGGFGNVYKGEIIHSKGQSMVAIKRLDRAFGQGNPEFWKEITMLSLYKHENLVHLLGFCDENDEKILVYEYAPKKSLDLYLSSNDLTWTQRLKICIGVARGLSYLHSPDTQVRVLHRDIKSSNILLDENWNAKISDFGLSKFAHANKFTFLFTSAVGTVGYCDPLYAETGFLTKESDIYSFGVVLYEMLEERPSITEVVRMLETALGYQTNEENWKPDVNDYFQEEAHLPDVMDASKANKESWEIPDIVDSFQLKALHLPDSLDASKVVRLIYTNSGSGLLALASNAIHKLWKWQPSEHNPSGKSTASTLPQLWKPTNGAVMCNDVSESKSDEESAACVDLSKNNSYIISASGGKVSLFNMMTFKVKTTFMPPPPVVTYLAFHPQDNNIIALGMEDSTIRIYNMRLDEVKIELKGHQKQITGLAFSEKLFILVSSGADAQASFNFFVFICVWDIILWNKRISESIEPPPGHPSPLIGETKIQLNRYQQNILVVHQSLIAIYSQQYLHLSKSWTPRESLYAAISSATYSCNGLLIFTGFLDGVVGVFNADTLELQCWIAPSAYFSSSISSIPYPVVVAAHPFYPNQFALGMSDGSVIVIEPADSDLKLDGAQKGSPALSKLKDNLESVRDL